jgi:hypothetical protein
MRNPTATPTYALALHWAYLTCPDVDLPEPQRSAAILRGLRESHGEEDPIYRHYSDKVRRWRGAGPERQALIRGLT